MENGWTKRIDQLTAELAECKMKNERLLNRIEYLELKLERRIEYLELKLERWNIPYDKEEMNG